MASFVAPGQRSQAADLDRQIADLEGQIAAAQGSPGAGRPDYSAFYQSPGYQFRFDEGLRAVDRSAAARGQLHSGGYGREISRYGQGFASGEFNNYANRLASMAGIAPGGPTSLSQPAGGSGSAQIGGGGTGAGFANTALGTAQGLSNAGTFGGTARASGYVGQANAYNQGLGNLAFGAQQYFGAQPSLQQIARADVYNPAYSGIF